MYGFKQCFTPGKDMLLPIYKSRTFVQASPYLTGVPQERRILFSFLGNAQRQPPRFSMGLRQQLWTAHSNRNDSCIPSRCAKHNAGCDLEAILPTAPSQCVLIGGHTRNFIKVLQRSIFCAVVPGNGWAHIEEPAIMGCIPVVIMPGIHVQLEGILDLSRFAIRITRDQIPHIVDILRAIPQQKVVEMQSELARVWERFTYSGVFQREFRMQRDGGNPQRLGNSRASDTKDFEPVESRFAGRDAVSGLIEQLQLRLQARRAAGTTATATTILKPEEQYIDHGPREKPYGAIPHYRLPDTRGVQ